MKFFFKDTESSPTSASLLNDESTTSLSKYIEDEKTITKKPATLNSVHASAYISGANFILNNVLAINTSSKQISKNESLVLANNKQIQNLNNEIRNESSSASNFSTIPISLASSNENVYFMMQSASDQLICSQQSTSPNTANCYTSSFKTTPLNSPSLNTSGKIYFQQQQQLNSILNPQNNNNNNNISNISSNNLPSIHTLSHSPLVSNSINLQNALPGSPGFSAKVDSFSSTASSLMSASVSPGVKVVRDERRRANHNEGQSKKIRT